MRCANDRARGTRPCLSARNGRGNRRDQPSERSPWRIAQDAPFPGAAEALVDQERLVPQFLGDLDLDRLDTVAAQFARVDGSSRAALVQAEVSSIVHRFDDARDHLARRSRTARLSMFAYDCADTPVHTLVCDSDR